MKTYSDESPERSAARNQRENEFYQAQAERENIGLPGGGCLLTILSGLVILAICLLPSGKHDA